MIIAGWLFCNTNFSYFVCVFGLNTLGGSLFVNSMISSFSDLIGACLIDITL